MCTQRCKRDTNDDCKVNKFCKFSKKDNKKGLFANAVRKVLPLTSMAQYAVEAPGGMAHLSRPAFPSMKHRTHPPAAYSTSSVQKPNSWTYNFLEVSGHNLESSQTWGTCMDFLNHREGGMVFYQVFLPSPLQCTVTNCRNFKRLREFEKIGHYLRVLRLEVSYPMLHYQPVSNHFCSAGGWSQSRPRIPPRDLNLYYRNNANARNDCSQSYYSLSAIEFYRTLFRIFIKDM